MPICRWTKSSPLRRPTATGCAARKLNSGGGRNGSVATCWRWLRRPRETGLQRVWDGPIPAAARTTSVIVLKSWGEWTKYGDANRIRKWLHHAAQKAEKTARANEGSAG